MPGERIGRRLSLREGGGYLVDFEVLKELCYEFLAEKGYPKRPGAATHDGPYPPV
jgi:hypothetical protein